MRSAQGKVLLFGAILVALIFLFPPWDYFDPDASGRASAGYHFLLTPPEPKSATEIFAQPRYPHMTRVRLSTIRFILQLLIAVPTWLGLAFVLESRRTVVSMIAGILFLLAGALVMGFVIWLLVSERLEYGHWSLP